MGLAGIDCGACRDVYPGCDIRRREMTLDDYVKSHDESCTCSMACTDELQYCDCGQPQRVAELAKLRAALDDAKKIFNHLYNMGQAVGIDYRNIDKWIELYGGEK
jgi:hypothetical protein